MVKNLDDLNHSYETEIATHLKVAAILRQEELFRLEAYDYTTFYTLESPCVRWEIGNTSAYGDSFSNGFAIVQL